MPNAVLVDIIQQIAPIYHSHTPTDTQRQLIETVIGAAIWYLPQPEDLWTGKISIGAVRMFHPESGVEKPKLTADHNFPRKIAAKELLMMQWSDIPQPGVELQRRYAEQ